MAEGVGVRAEASDINNLELAEDLFLVASVRSSSQRQKRHVCCARHSGPTEVPTAALVKTVKLLGTILTWAVMSFEEVSELGLVLKIQTMTENCVDQEQQNLATSAIRETSKMGRKPVTGPA